MCRSWERRVTDTDAGRYLAALDAVVSAGAPCVTCAVVQGSKAERVSTEIRFPKIGFSMGEGMLTQWVVADGANVVEGRAIYTLESEKAIEKVEAPSSGRLRIIGLAGSVYRVGDLIGTIE